MSPPPSSAIGRRVGLIVVAGGRSTRWAGVDKTAQLLLGQPVLLHVVTAGLAGIQAATQAPDDAAPPPVVIVAPSAHPARAQIDRTHPQVRWTVEEPAGGGPVAALAAGLSMLAGSSDLVVVLAGDMPCARTAVVRLVAAGRAEPDDAHPAGVVGIDPDGVRQPLLAVYRSGPLAEALAGLPPAHASMRSLLAGLGLSTLPVTARESLDLDTPEALAVVERTLLDS
ncbi:MAG: NTP transferase domain-containing protein [Kineosporiaceae bacterium]|nr:NTP transferase domain-containing protein [Kineosporiaceae bacterium]MBK8078003.1 NTP transferase domain-containing protein [Kineosporiaceae bacterium]